MQLHLQRLIIGHKSYPQGCISKCECIKYLCEVMQTHIYREPDYRALRKQLGESTTMDRNSAPKGGAKKPVKKARKASRRKRPIVDYHLPIAISLRNARLAAGFETVSEAARFIGMSVQSAIAHEGKGVSFRYPKLEHLRKYASAYRTTIDALEGDVKPANSGGSAVPTRNVPTRENMVSAPILGTAQAGHWREVDPFAAEAEGAVPTKPQADYVFAVNVAGDSMNKVIQDGDVAIIRPWATMKRDPMNNDVVLVQRERNGKYELTVKTFRDKKLWPESTNPKWRHPIAIDDGDIVTVVGLIVGLYRPL